VTAVVYAPDFAPFSDDWTRSLRHAVGIALGIPGQTAHRLQSTPLGTDRSRALVKPSSPLPTEHAQPLVHRSAQELFAAHASFVAGFLWRMGAPDHEIEDLVQDVFLIAHMKGGFQEREAKATTWLAAIAFRVWSSERRRFRRHSELPNSGAIVQAEAHGPSPADALSAAESLGRIRTILEGLDERSRAILILVDLEGTSCVEVAEALGIPVGTVYSRVHSARKRFARAYERLGKSKRKDRRGT
jgi:RNA polymerase sigma-70 factor, ECF subfamily